MSNIKFNATFEYKLIYVFSINDDNHRNMLKVGEATIKGDKDYTKYFPNCSELNTAAHNRIKQYTNTAGITYKLEYTEIAVYDEEQENGTFKTKYFTDHKVHKVLKRSGIENHYFDNKINANEWFLTNLETVKNAIKAVKNNQSSLTSSQISDEFSEIIFRPEQEKAITETIKQFQVSNRMLWNAKMRFGKTLSALEVIKRMQLEKSIIITHRPDVNDGWFKDFHKIFFEKNTNYIYGSKTKGYTIQELLKSNKPFIYFASIQDLRGSLEAGGKYEKNDEVFAVKWDLVITDEAHEGTQTELGKKVREKLINDNNKELSLSGTPFNLFDMYSSENTFTWDYIMEQEAKQNWYRDPQRLGDHNPYEELPKLNIFTYHLEKLLVHEKGAFIDLVDKAFNFREFFRVWTGDKNKDNAIMPKGTKKGQFVHESAVNAFLDLLCKKDEDTNYPFSNDTYRDFFRHSLWMIPGVKEGKALEELLKKHIVFGNGNFNIVNVAGEGGDEYKEEKKALDKLRRAIGDKSEESRTITLSCGRLTTGVTVPEWTAVFMLSGGYTTDAKSYLQTIFRVQSPANINGKIKQNCYVFDFAPDRTLRVIHEAVKRSASRRQPPVKVEYLMSGFLNFCPVISFEESEMKEYKAGELLQQIKRVYAERVVESGFEDTKLYNDELLRLDGIELEKFDNLQKIIGKTKQTKKASDVDLVKNGLTEEERKRIEELEKKKKSKQPLTEEEKAELERKKKLYEQRTTAITILRGVSIRMPLLIYGLDKDFDTEIKIEDLLDDDIIDEASWEEFMPNGVTKEIFKDFIKYYDKDIFIAACRKIRAISKNSDNYSPTERVKELAKLFIKFKNPDKETVLTPWKVVNMHLSQTIGGFSFFDEHFDSELDEPILIEHEQITNNIFTKDSKILEINSKSGLYPLYVTYSLYREHVKNVDTKELTIEKEREIWDKVVKEQVFVICKTPMARLITKRTLLGYRDGKVNAHAFDDLIMQMKDKPEKLVSKICSYGFWKKKGKGIMKFNAIVGNPPYQGTNHQQIYPYFYLTSIMLGSNVSLIFPIGWQEPKNGNNLSKLNNEQVKRDKQIVFIDNRQNVFPGIMGAEWTNIILWKKDYDNKLNGSQLVYTNGTDGKIIDLIWDKNDVKKPEEIQELGKIILENPNFISVDTITTSRKPFPLVDRKVNIIIKDERYCDDLIIYNYSGNKYISKDEISKFKESAKRLINGYKVFIPYAWGNWSDNYLGGAYADIIVAKPGELCFDDTYLVSGPFESMEKALYHAKYLLTTFARALLYINKYSQHSTTAWHAIILQDFKENWWDKSVKEIDEELFKKYNVPKHIRDFVQDNIQKRSAENIIIH